MGSCRGPDFCFLEDLASSFHWDKLQPFAGLEMKGRPCEAFAAFALSEGKVICFKEFISWKSTCIHGTIAEICVTCYPQQCAVSAAFQC